MRKKAALGGIVGLMGISALVTTIITAIAYLGIGSVILLIVRKNLLLFLGVIGLVFLFFVFRNWKRG